MKAQQASQCNYGKIAYTDQRTARSAMHRMMARGTKKREKVNVYYCPECGGWHFGHKGKWKGEKL